MSVMNSCVIAASWCIRLRYRLHTISLTTNEAPCSSSMSKLVHDWSSTGHTYTYIHIYGSKLYIIIWMWIQWKLINYYRNRSIRLVGSRSRRQKWQRTHESVLASILKKTKIKYSVVSTVKWFHFSFSLIHL